MSEKLTLVQVSQIALSAAIPLGFNAAEVTRWCDPEDFCDRVCVTFGDRDTMKRPRLRTPCEWAYSYSEEDPCIREPKIVRISPDLFYKSGDELNKKFTAELLELR